MGKKERKNELLPGTLEMLILKTLMHRPKHGYAIAQDLLHGSQDVLQVEEGSLYPALQRLQLQGWVTSQWATSNTGRRVRQYRITAAGRKELGVQQSKFERMIAAIARVMETA